VGLQCAFVALECRRCCKGKGMSFSYLPLGIEAPIPDVDEARQVEYKLVLPRRKIKKQEQGLEQRLELGSALKLGATLGAFVAAVLFLVLLAMHKSGAFAELSSTKPFWAMAGILTIHDDKPESSLLSGDGGMLTIRDDKPESTSLDAWRPAQGRIAFCNIVATLPRLESYRRWDLGPMWIRVCGKQLSHKYLAEDRNRCWVGMKAQCHSHLKAHFPWAKLQRMAADLGSAPPRTHEPFDPVENPQVCDRPDAGRTRQWTHKEKMTARKWFRTHVGVYVLGLFSDVDRWNMISERLRQLQIYATRINGVDMRQPGALEDAKAAGWVPHDFNFTRAQEVAYRPAHGMGSILGTLGCASAHFKAHSQVVADGMPLAVVFEDDSWPSDDFVERLWSLVHVELPCDWEVVSLYSRCPYGSCVSQHLLRVQPDRNEPAWRCHQGVNWGMQAILYRTKSLSRIQIPWMRVAFNESRPHCMDVDVALASISDEVHYYAVPSVQDPGFVNETNHPSARWSINHFAATSSTTRNAASIAEF